MKKGLLLTLSISLIAVAASTTAVSFALYERGKVLTYTDSNSVTHNVTVGSYGILTTRCDIYFNPGIWYTGVSSDIRDNYVFCCVTWDSANSNNFEWQIGSEIYDYNSDSKFAYKFEFDYTKYDRLSFHRLEKYSIYYAENNDKIAIPETDPVVYKYRLTQASFTSLNQKNQQDGGGYSVNSSSLFSFDEDYKEGNYVFEITYWEQLGSFHYLSWGEWGTANDLTERS